MSTYDNYTKGFPLSIEDYIFDSIMLMKDPNMDGFAGFGRKQELYLLWNRLNEVLNDPTLPNYFGEHEWVSRNISSTPKQIEMNL